MGGELEVDTVSNVGSDVSSMNGLQYPDMTSLIEEGTSAPQDSSRVEPEEFVHLPEDEPEPAAVSLSDSFISQASTSETSIQAHLGNSTYGMLLDVIRGIEIKLDQELPQVILTGNQSAGKSSVLARILFRLLLPSDYGMTTRCPIRLCLKNAPNLSTQRIYLQTREEGLAPYFRDVSHVADLAPLLTKEMDVVCGNEQSMSSEEVLVQIHSAQVPNMELVDLPGLVAFPESLCRRSEELLRKYASDPHCLVLCVAEATMASLNNSRPLAMLEEMGRLGNTLLVLTKVDTVPDNELGYKTEILGARGRPVQGLAGAVGLVNPHHSQLTPEGLAGAEEREREVFAQRLPGLVYGRDVGIVALLSMLTRRMHEVIVTQWVPSAQGEVARHQALVTQQCEALGDAPHVYKGDVSRLLAQVCSGSASLLAKETRLVRDFVAKSPVSSSSSATSGEAEEEDYDVFDRSHVRGRLADCEGVKGMAMGLVADLKGLAMAHLCAVLRDEEPGVRNVEKLARFHNLRQACERVMEALLEELGQAAWAKAEKITDFHFQRMAGRALSPNFGTELFRAIAEAMVAELLVPLEDFFAYRAPSGSGPLQSDFQRRVEESPLSSSTSATNVGAEDGGDVDVNDVEGSDRADWLRGLLTESDEVAGRRAQLKASYDRHKHALQRLERMRDLQYGQALE